MIYLRGGTALPPRTPHLAFFRDLRLGDDSDGVNMGRWITRMIDADRSGGQADLHYACRAKFHRSERGMRF